MGGPGVHRSIPANKSSPGQVTKSDANHEDDDDDGLGDMLAELGIAAGVQDIPLQVPQQPHQRQQEHEYHPEEWEEEESSVQRCPDANIAVEEASEEENDSEYQKALQDSMHEMYVSREFPPLPGTDTTGGGDNNNSVAVVTAAPGLRNETGEYNCFLNAIIQCLWQCRSFSRALLQQDVSQLQGSGESRAIVVALVALLKDFAAHEVDPTSGSVDPNALRLALSGSGLAFKMGEMNDASEVLRKLYESVDECGLGAIVNKSFGSEVMEGVNCEECDRRSHLNSYTQYFVNVNATALRDIMLEEDPLRQRNLGMRLRLIEDSVYKTCDVDEKGCGRLSPVTRSLSEMPQVFSLEVGWTKMSEEPVDIENTLKALNPVINPAEVYQGVVACSKKLRAMVCYYGQHYSAYVQPRGGCSWLSIDDTQQRELGSWADVKAQCVKGRVQPSVLFFDSSQEE